MLYITNSNFVPPLTCKEEIIYRARHGEPVCIKMLNKFFKTETHSNIEKGLFRCWLYSMGYKYYLHVDESIKYLCNRKVLMTYSRDMLVLLLYLKTQKSKDTRHINDIMFELSTEYEKNRNRETV